MGCTEMEGQVELVQAAEDYGFTGIWLRDVILHDPAFGDPATGQIYDMLIYLTYLAAQTKKIAFGTSSIVLPLRHPLRVAKGTKRTSELKRAMPSITQKMLTQQLRELEADNIITRNVYQQVPPRVEYDLTEYGKTLSKVLDVMCEWGERHIENQLRKIVE